MKIYIAQDKATNTILKVFVNKTLAKRYQRFSNRCFKYADRFIVTQIHDVDWSHFPDNVYITQDVSNQNVLHIFRSYAAALGQKIVDERKGIHQTIVQYPITY